MRVAENSAPAGSERAAKVATRTAGNGPVETQYNTCGLAEQDAGALRLTIADFHGEDDNRPKTRVLPWEQIVKAVIVHRELERKEDGALFSPTRYRPKTTRANSNVAALTLAVAEWDHGTASTFAEVTARLRAAGYAFAAFSTYRNTPEAPRFRVVVPFACEVAAADWRGGARIFARIREHVFAGTNEQHDADEARMYYYPACPPGALRFADHADGKALDAYSLPEMSVEAAPSGDGHRQAAPGELSGLPIGRMALEFIALGAPFDAGGDTQRKTACAVARNLHEAGLPVEKIAAAIWRGFQVCEQRPDDPWTEEHARYIAEDIANKPAPPAKPLEAGPTVTFGSKAQDEGAEEPGDHDLDGTQKDYGHAAVLSRLFKNRYRWAVHRGSWMRWPGKVWQPVPEEAVAKEAADALRRDYSAQLAVAADKHTIQDLSKKVGETCVYARITGALSFLKGWPGVLTMSEEWDRNPWLLNVGNGTIDLSAGLLLPHDPGDLITKLAPVDFDPEARGEAWQRHVELFLPNVNIRRQVQRDLGLALPGVTLEESLPLWYGTGANGKTTTARVLLRVLDDYADRAAPNLLVESKYERHPTEVADLCGKRLVFSVEVDQGKQLAEALVKDLTGGDRKKGRYMRQDFFTFEQTFSIILIVNHKPIVTGTDEGIWRRIKVVPWERRILVGEKRPQEEVVTELAAEGAAILNWLLDGLRDWQQDHGWTAPEVRAASEQYRAEMDVLGDFIRDCCILGPRYEVPKAELYVAYASWCEANREKPLGKTTFGGMLQGRGIGGRKGAKGARLHVGVGLLAGKVANGGGLSCSSHERSILAEEQENVPPNATQPPLARVPGPKYDIGQWVNAVSADGVLQTSKPVQILDIYESTDGRYFYALPDTNAGWPEEQIEPAESPAPTPLDSEPGGEPEGVKEWPISLNL